MALPEEYELFRKTLREYMEDNIAPDLPEADKKPLSKDALIDYQKGLIRDLGVGFSPDTEQDYTGDPFMYGIVSEEMSRVWPSLNVSLNMSFPGMFVEHAAEPTRDAMFPKYEAGELVACLGVTEPQAGSDSRQLQTTAEPDGDEWVLNGQKTWVSNAPVADLALVSAINQENGERDMYLVDRENSSFETSMLDKIGWKGSPTGEIFLDDCRIPRGNSFMELITARLESGEDLEDISPLGDTELDPLNAMFAFMRTGMGLMSVGIMQAAFEAAVDYCRERETFGKKLGEHQLIQEKIYDIKAAVESSRQMAYHTLDLLSRGDPEARKMSSLVKGYACEKAVEATYDASQVYGAMGLSKEYPLERYFRDARVMTIPDGTTEIQKLIVGKEILGLSAYA